MTLFVPPQGRFSQMTSHVDNGRHGNWNTVSLFFSICHRCFKSHVCKLLGI